MESAKEELSVAPHLLLTPTAEMGTGRCSSVSVCLDPSTRETVVVSVFDATAKRGLYYRVGLVDDDSGTTSWGDGNSVGCVSRQYSKGRHPSVCLVDLNDALYVVECHCLDVLKVCYCCVGRVNVANRSIKWGEWVSVGNGKRPRVSATGKKRVVIVMEDSCTVDDLKYLVGTINPGDMSISFAVKDGKKLEELKGIEPDVAINDKDSVVVICRSVIGGDIITLLGTLVGDSIDWKADSSVGVTGKTPAISLNSEGCIVEVHQGLYWKQLFFTCGYITIDKAVEWGNTKKLTRGEYPAIALSKEGDIFEVHARHIGFQLAYSQGKLKY